MQALSNKQFDCGGVGRLSPHSLLSTKGGRKDMRKGILFIIASLLLLLPFPSFALNIAGGVMDDSITAEKFADDDWGDLSVSSNTVTLDSGVVDSTAIKDGTITNTDISSSAAIANSKLASPKSYFTICLTSDGQYTASLDPLRTFQMPFAATLVEVSVCARDIDTADGDETYTIDIEEGGTSVLSSAISITADNTPVVGTISDSDIADTQKWKLC